MKSTCLVIGGGPAGIATAIQLDRYGLDTILVEKGKIGGLIFNANFVENYLGFPNGIKGPALASLIEKHLNQTMVVVKSDEIRNIEFEGGLFRANGKSEQYEAEFLILASGTVADELQYDGLNSIPFERIHTDLRTLYDVENKVIGIVGAGDAAFDYGINLSSKNHVLIINRRNSHKALPLLWDRIQKVEEIDYLVNSKIMKLSFKTSLLQIHLRDGSIKEIDHLLFAIGRKPDLSLIPHALQGVLKEQEKEGKFEMVGDVKNGIYRQVSIAAGDGIKAAMIIYRKINEL